VSFPVSTPLQHTHGRSITADRTLLRLSATLLFIGLLLFALATYLHSMIDAKVGVGNNHKAAFAVYAASGDWTAVHLGLFVGIAVISAGLLVLFFALNVSEGTPRWVGLFGAIAAVVALALYGIVSAVDGVTLKQAAVAWASAPAAEQAVRFASAEAIRWLEWGTKSYWSFMQGLALVLFALVIVWTARVPRPIGYLMGLSGLAFFVDGWLLGSEGFSATETVPDLIWQISLVVWIIWLLIVAWRRKASFQAAPA
jgi:hypothetical protein